MRKKLINGVTGVVLVALLCGGIAQAKVKNVGGNAPVKMYNKVMYASETVNIRRCPSTKAKIIGKLDKGLSIGVVSRKSNWYSVRYRGRVSYISAKYLKTRQPLLRLSSTAYWDKYHRHSASGRRLLRNFSLAGKVSWLGRRCRLYRCNKDGSVGKLLGTYRFDDTGYGRATGVGSSSILKGRTVGNIENGTCVDIFKNTENDCVAYGRRNVYLQWLN